MTNRARALANYYSILNGDRRAKYLDAKSVPIAIDLDVRDESLWKAHGDALARPGRLESGRPAVSLLDLKSELAHRILKKCSLCERKCGVDRTSGETGHCGVLNARVSSEFIHMGEEPDLVPSYTIFFSGCTFNCVFCQNWDISTKPASGEAIDAFELARAIERRAGLGAKVSKSGEARNVNWVGGDPTANLPFILDVLRDCNAKIPQVWNSNMYLTESAMNLLDGIVDVYLTDFKYGNDKCALRLSNAPSYMKVVKRNHLHGRRHAEMIIRHLVLPGHIDCCTKPVLAWIADNLHDVKVNVMAQYRPEHRAREFDEIARPLKLAEYRTALDIAERLDLDLCD